MMIRPVGRLSANNAAADWMNASNSLIGLCSFSGNPRFLLEQEKRLNARMLQNSLIYKASLLMEETSRKLAKENIKRSFSTFA